MKLNDFSLVIRPGRETDQGHVILPHGQVYTVGLYNYWPRRATAELWIDGKEIGTFVLAAHGSTRLERPLDDSGRFTFYRLDSPEAAQVGLVDGSQLGLVQVTFVPEIERPRMAAVPISKVVRSGRLDAEHHLMAAPQAASFSDYGPIKGTRSTGEGQSLSAGGTGLSGYSGQEFHTVNAFPLDKANQTTISLRLVAGDDGPQPLVGRAVGPFANPVPERP